MAEKSKREGRRDPTVSIYLLFGTGMCIASAFLPSHEVYTRVVPSLFPQKGYETKSQ
jgi:hypothetical protein